MISRQQMEQMHLEAPNVPVTMLAGDIMQVASDISRGTEGYYLNATVTNEQRADYQPITGASLRLINDPEAPPEEFNGSYLHATVRLARKGNEREHIGMLQSVVDGVAALPEYKGNRPVLFHPTTGRRNIYYYKLNSMTQPSSQLYLGIHSPDDDVGGDPFIEISNGLVLDPEAQQESFNRVHGAHPLVLSRPEAIEHLNELLVLTGDVMNQARKVNGRQALDEHFFYLQSPGKLRAARVLGAAGMRTAIALPQGTRDALSTVGLTGAQVLQLAERSQQENDNADK